MPIQRAKPKFTDVKNVSIAADQLNVGQIGGRRNIVINGAMQVAQRATSETDLGASSKYSTLDRYAVTVGDTAGRFTMSQSAVTDLEGFSNALLEYMAAGLPVVATDVGGNSEAIIDGFNGFIVPPKNPEELGESILKMSKLQKRCKMGLHGKNRVKDFFELGKCIEEYENLYLESAKLSCTNKVD